MVGSVYVGRAVGFSRTNIVVVLVRELNGCAARIAQNGKGAETLVVGERNSVVSSIVGRIVVAYQLAVLFVLNFQIFRRKSCRQRKT